MKPKCRELEESFTPYVDGEATPEQRAAVESHLAACPPCRERVAEERAGRDVVKARREAVRGCAPGALRARCAGHARSTAAEPAHARRRPWTRRALVPLSLAATLLLAVAGVFLFSLSNPVEALAAQLTVDHVKCFELTPEERIADAPAAARQWTQARGWSIGVPPGDEGMSLELVGVRRCISTDGSAAHLMYRWRGEPLSVYIVPKTFPGVSGVQRLVEHLGHGAVIWSKDSRTYLVLTRRRTADLDAVVAYIRARVE